MNKQELIEKYKNKYPVISMDVKEFRYFIELWEDMKQLDEPQKPVVPQFVANWYEDIKVEFYVVLERLVLNYKNNTDMPICKWFFETEDALTILINMHQFGYTVEKEKRYLVKMKGVDSKTNYLYYGMGSKTWLFKAKLIDGLFRKSHTRKELEEAGFGEVFNSPLFEVEEVYE